MEFIIFSFLLLISGVISQYPPPCENLTIPICRNLGYNYTSMPNKFNHANQEEARYMLYQFSALLKTHCSEDLLLFLCSLYAPVCIEDYKRQLPPCSSVCVRVKSGCGSIMKKYGFGWPDQMKCGHFPKYGDKENLCMHSKEGNEKNEKKDRVSKSKSSRKRISRTKIKKKLESTPTTAEPECRCECRQTFQTNEIVDCTSPCKNPFFDEYQQHFSSYWICSWAVIACMTASLTVLTFIVDESRFCYPERPIIFLSGCYIMISMGYLLPFGFGHEYVACNGQIAFNQNAREAPSLSCTVSFLLIYFFTMASSLWWVVLGFTWFLAAGLKWSNEAIAKYAHYYHYVAWLLPTSKSITILWIGAVDGDPISGVCSVGNQNIIYLLWYVIIPQTLYLALGAVLLIAGFTSLVHIRSVVKRQATAQTADLEKLMLKICVFSVLYITPAVIYIACLFYEYQFRESWIRSHNCPCEKIKVKPYYFVFVVKYCMRLVIGFTSVYWIISRETLDSWYCLFCTQAPKRTNSDGGSQRTQTPVIQEMDNNTFELYTIS